MRKLNNKSGSVILITALMLVVTFSALEFFIYNTDLPIIEEPENPDMGVLGLGIIPWFQTQLSNLGSLLAFDFQIFKAMGDIGGLVRGALWIAIIVGIIDIVWIG